MFRRTDDACHLLVYIGRWTVITQMYHCASRSALHYAAGNVNYTCVVSLVTAGAEINVLDNRGCTPLHYAAASDVDAK